MVVLILSRYLKMRAKHSKGCKLIIYKNYNDVNLINSRSKFSLLLFFVFSLVISQSVTANSLEEVDDKELTKLISQEQYVAVLFSKLSNYFALNTYQKGF